MSNHTVRFVGLEDQWQAKCSCRGRSPIGSRGDADTWKWQHLQDVQRIRAALARTPGLRTLIAYYREQAADPTNPRAERELWQMLADELENRVRLSVDEDQLELW